MDNKSTTKRMIGAVVLVLIAALLLAWLLKGKNKSVQEQQELIAEQTQDATPILGFPGVNNDGEQTAEGQVAQNGEAAQDGSGSYVIGAADQLAETAGTAQQEAQSALAAGGEQVADAGKALGDAAGAAATAAQDAAGTVAAKAVDSATGFQVRDSQGGDAAATEQRQVSDAGKVEAGTGSMGANEVATAADQATQAAGADATQTAAASGDGAKAATDSASGGATQQPKVSAVDSNSGGSSAAKPAAKTAAVNPKLVNEKPVPAPKTQTASKSASNTKSSSRSSARTGSASSRSGSAASSTASSGAKGYAIQVLAASSRSKAETVKEDIARDGYPAFVVRANVNGKTVYRVRVGTYPAKGAARAVQTRMKARYSKNQYVQNSFVTKN